MGVARDIELAVGKLLYEGRHVVMNRRMFHVSPFLTLTAPPRALIISRSDEFHAKMRSQYRIYKGRCALYHLSCKSDPKSDHNFSIGIDETGDVELQGIDLTQRPGPPTPEKCERGESISSLCCHLLYHLLDCRNCEALGWLTIPTPSSESSSGCGGRFNTRDALFPSHRLRHRRGLQGHSGLSSGPQAGPSIACRTPSRRGSNRAQSHRRKGSQASGGRHQGHPNLVSPMGNINQSYGPLQCKEPESLTIGRSCEQGWGGLPLTSTVLGALIAGEGITLLTNRGRPVDTVPLDLAAAATLGIAVQI